MKGSDLKSPQVITMQSILPSREEMSQWTLDKFKEVIQYFISELENINKEYQLHYSNGDDNS
jgi:hypothetical protein